MPAPPMPIYLEQLGSLEGKDVACLVTCMMPATWARSQTLELLTERCGLKGTAVLGTGGVWWLAQVVGDALTASLRS